MGLSLISFLILLEVGGYRDATPVNGASVGDLPLRCRNGRFHFGATKMNSLSLRGQTTSSSLEIGGAEALCEACRFLRWQIVKDLFVFADDRHSVYGQWSVS